MVKERKGNVPPKMTPALGFADGEDHGMLNPTESQQGPKRESLLYPYTNGDPLVVRAHHQFFEVAGRGKRPPLCKAVRWPGCRPPETVMARPKG
ncbi:hypothetical protein P7K49_030195 [Saguinus oedipus]|uniref:Uncharacterized protein n=1 Tax=Saguinus oedipus TaxID=9490 RepID=A0ABQ9U1M2_SAGOE|nr:hypothetical protein P7K49_030195 [Saguinus oedipus]